jgi:hypothetical protein
MSTRSMDIFIIAWLAAMLQVYMYLQEISILSRNA